MRRWRQFERRACCAEAADARARHRAFHDYRSAADDVRVLAHSALYFVEHAIGEHRSQRRSAEDHCAQFHIVRVQHRQQRFTMQSQL